MRVDGSSGEKLYYVLRPGGETDGKIFTPVEGGKQVLRGIITREEAERLIDEIPSIETLSIENEKFREDSYKKCIRTCECRDLLRIIKTIYCIVADSTFKAALGICVIPFIPADLIKMIIAMIIGPMIKKRIR